MSSTRHFNLHPDVAAALAQNKPLVALESTVIAHGLPRPQNLATAERLEQIVKANGATPATIALVKGQICVGLDAAQLEHIANAQNVHKISTRDLAVAVTQEWDGATTVAATCWIAERAGIEVFATGGIGGVHRGALPDVSADLPELARTRLVVVCAGAKSVLDLPATREWLETHAVTIAGYGCDELPAFYTRRSGLPVDVRVESAAEVAALVRARRGLGLPGALLVAVPVPVESEVLAEVIRPILERALTEAEQSGVGGRELTPFLLRRMSEQSGGATLRANLALLEQNARVAAQIAKAVSCP